MKLDGLFPVCLFDLYLGCIGRDSQGVVVGRVYHHVGELSDVPMDGGVNLVGRQVQKGVGG